MDGIAAGGLIADNAYDTESVAQLAQEANMQRVIPSRIHRKKQRILDKFRFRLRHKIENTFQKLKEWQGIATRYAKNSASFLAAVYVKLIAVWV